SAPYLAHEISKYLPADQNQTANLMAHAVLGAVVGHFNGNATVGAVSAFTAEAAAPAIINAMGWDKDHLTEQQKQTVSALGTLAAGLAGGLTSNSTADTVAGAQTGKNAVENNALGNKKGCGLDPLACRDSLIEGGGIRGGGISAKTPTGSKGNVLKVQDGSNRPTTINDRQFSGHALDRMQKQGITPTVVEGAIVPGNA
ncbi:TPA: VENN motif pre-toxin domain-containing protein, partial [Yersinia enterocolitica]